MLTTRIIFFDSRFAHSAKSDVRDQRFGHPWSVRFVVLEVNSKWEQADITIRKGEVDIVKIPLTASKD
jgi:hypothetical protein